MNQKNMQENTKKLQGRIPSDLYDQFYATMIKGMKVQHVYSAVARLWVEIPAELRKKLVDSESEENTEKRDNYFTEAVRQIFYEEIQKLNLEKK